ncbi:MAG TPA: XRE family transcriptional regulator [Armatimonadota bacterium]|nr:XRE family transcriptional regulator [Armatimonadota bacterium]
MKTSTSDAAEILDLEFGDDPQYQAALTDARTKSQAARAIYEARVAAGLTRKQLADLIGANQSVISRLEDADYDRHSLAMLDRIARALNRRVEVRLVRTVKPVAR